MQGFAGLFDWGEKRHLPPNVLCGGLNYPLTVLRNKHERIEWHVFCRVIANSSPLSDEEFVDLDRESVLRVRNSPESRRWADFFSPALISTGGSTARQSALEHQLFTCINPTVTQIDGNRLIVTLQLVPDYEHCREFFLITRGCLEMASTYMGLKPSRVEMHEVDHGAVYDIYCPEGGGALSWVRKAVTWPFAARISSAAVERGQ